MMPLLQDLRCRGEHAAWPESPYFSKSKLQYWPNLKIKRDVSCVLTGGPRAHSGLVIFSSVSLNPPSLPLQLPLLKYSHSSSLPPIQMESLYSLFHHGPPSDMKPCKSRPFVKKDSSQELGCVAQTVKVNLGVDECGHDEWEWHHLLCLRVKIKCTMQFCKIKLWVNINLFAFHKCTMKLYKTYENSHLKTTHQYILALEQQTDPSTFCT